MKLRTELRVPAGAVKLLVVVYARYSSDEQDESSITDQIRLCRDFLDASGVPYDLTDLHDDGISGELRDRPAICEVRAGILQHRWHLILCEDSSRLFRNETACIELVEMAADERIRVICINDDVDTAEEDWLERLHDAQRQHTGSNRYLRNRIARKRRGLWATGGAMGILTPGYRRRPTTPASNGEPAKGPFFDEIDPEQAPKILECFRRIAQGDEPWTVAEYATQIQLPKYGNSVRPQYTVNQIYALVRRTIYRGEETYRKKVVEKKLRTGKKRQRFNDPEEIWTRPMPHLRIVPDALWYAANEALNRRSPARPPRRGADHPLYCIPRVSRGPLSGVFVCMCGEKMWVDGRAQGGYRCRHRRQRACWNHASALRATVHKHIAWAISEQLLRIAGLPQIVECIAERLRSDDTLLEQIRDAERQETALQRASERLLSAIETSDVPVDALTAKLRDREHELAVVRARLAQLQELLRQVKDIPSPDEITARVQTFAAEVLDFSRESGSLLRRLVAGMIVAQPYRQFGTNKVVLRAEFTLNLVAFVNERILNGLLTGTEIPRAELGEVCEVAMVVDLFERPGYVRNASEAVRLHDDEKLKLVAVGQRLGVSKRNAHLAVHLGRQMRAAGILDPYVRLSERPSHASRWREGQRKAPDSDPGDDSDTCLGDQNGSIANGHP